MPIPLEAGHTEIAFVIAIVLLAMMGTRIAASQAPSEVAVVASLAPPVAEAEGAEAGRRVQATIAADGTWTVTEPESGAVVQGSGIEALAAWLQQHGISRYELDLRLEVLPGLEAVAEAGAQVRVISPPTTH